MQFAARFEFALDEGTAALCRALALDDLPAERIWGEIEKLLLQADASVDRRPRSRSTSASIRRRSFRSSLPLVGCEQEPEWHPEGDVWTHTLMVIDKARALNGDLDRAAAHHGHARRRLPRSRQAADDGASSTGGFDRSTTSRRASSRRCALLDRLNIHYDRRVRRARAGGRTRRASPEAGCVHQGRRTSATAPSGGSRRRSTSSCSPVLARADCLGRAGDFDCSAMDWFIERARALGVEHQPPAPLLLGRHLLALGLSPGPQIGEILRRGIRKAARRRDHVRRVRNRRSAPAPGVRSR